MSKSILVATPRTRPLYSEYVESLLYSQKPADYYWRDVPHRPVDVARNAIVDTFLRMEQKPAYLLMADDDATWGDDAIMRLISRDLPVVSAVIYRRGLPPVPTQGSYAGLSEKGNHSYRFGYMVEKVIEHAKRLGISEGNLEEAVPTNRMVFPKTPHDIVNLGNGGSGFHFMLIRRDVLEKIEPPWFQVVTPAPWTGYGGEDFYFCRKLVEAGYSVNVDLSVHTGHMAGERFEIGLREFLGFYLYTQMLKDKQIWEV